ncbi:MAG: hypothetical protein AAGG48_15180 [Planctomycetota bacterium]
MERVNIEGMDQELNPYAPSIETESAPLPSDLLGGRLKSTEIGLRLVCVGMLLTATAWIVGIFARSYAGGIGVPMSLIGLLAMIGILMLNAGPVMCLTVPAGYGLRPFAIATVAAQGLGFLGFIASLLLGGMIIMMGAMLIVMVAGSLFLFFLYRLANCIRRADLVIRIRQVSMFWSVVVFGFFPMAFVSSRSVNLAAVLLFGYMIALGLATLAYAMLSYAVANSLRYPKSPTI